MSDVRNGTSATPRAFAERLLATLPRGAVGSDGAGEPNWLTGCYLHGSAALGGWNPSRSDVDLLLVVSEWSCALSDALTAALTSPSIPCPGQGLECSVVEASAARTPGAPWPFLLHINTSTDTSAASGMPSTRDRVRVVDGGAMPGDIDLLMHYTVTRSRGVTIAGSPPAVAIGEVPRDAVLMYLHDELEWGLAHATEPYVVLNALRAADYARDGNLLSKVAAGLAALDDADLPPGLVRRALAAQTGEAPAGTPGPDATAVVRRTQALLTAAAREADG